jgi:hypothetical protein
VSPERLAELGLPPHNWRPTHTDHLSALDAGAIVLDDT